MLFNEDRYVRNMKINIIDFICGAELFKDVIISLGISIIFADISSTHSGSSHGA